MNTGNLYIPDFSQQQLALDEWQLNSRQNKKAAHAVKGNPADRVPLVK